MNDEELKAILIIDMPDNCYQCSCLQAEISCGTIRKHICGADYHKITELYKRNNCPLKPMPSHKDIIPKDEYFDEQDHIDDLIDMSFNEGYNKCIDEILGEE